jgi:hypothetical protein
MLAAAVKKMEEDPMMKSLRKRHLQVWSLLALLVPLGIISAWLAVPPVVKNKLLQPGTAEILPVITASVEKNNYTVHLRSNKERTQFQLEWISKEVSVLPSSLIYKISRPENELIGRIELKGTYRFPLDTSFRTVDRSAYQLLLYDIIHRQIIDSIKFIP